MNSLFPAYGAAAKRDVPTEDIIQPPGPQLEWLQNTSFTPQNASVLESISIETTKIKEEVGLEEDLPDDHVEAIVQAAATEIREHSHRRTEKRKSKHKHKKRRKSQNRSRSSSLERVVQQNQQLIDSSSSKKIFIEDVGLRPEHAFRVDRKPDRNNLAFSSLSHAQIARYVRSVPRLGSAADRRSWRENMGNEPTKKNRKGQRDSRYYESPKRLYDENGIVDLSKPRGTTKEQSQQIVDAFRCAYLPLGAQSSDRKSAGEISPQIRDISVNPLGIYDQNTSLYFQGNGPSPGEATEDAPDQGKNAKGTYKETHAEYIQRLTTEYNKHLRENPHDVKKWLEFVGFQSDAMESNSFSGKLTAAKHLKMSESVLLEKKIAILDRAINGNPKSVELITSKYDLCKDVWDTDKLVSEWKKILFVHPNNTWLWQNYLLFFQTRFSAFTITKFSKLYAKCFDMLKKIHGGLFQSHKPLPHMEENMIDIFSNFCRVLYQCGHRERAIANFQALIEFNFFPSKHLSANSTLEDRLAFFEPFWDSGVPRFGEEGSPGWCNATQEQTLHPNSQQNSEEENEDNVLKPDHPRWQNWLNLEKFREGHNWLPWRPSDMEDECEDPDRMVLFDDISPGLFHIRQEYSKFILLVRFLEMLGVLITPHFQSTCKLLNCHHPSGVTESSKILDGHRRFNWRFYRSDRSAGMLSLSAPTECSRGFESFVDRVFERSCSLLNGHYKKSMILLRVSHHVEKLKSTRNPKLHKKETKDTKKLFKSMLKAEENRNNLDLWCEYAKLEWRSRNPEEARKIFNLTLATHTQAHGEWNAMDGEQKSSICRIYRTYACLELGCDECSFAEETEFKDGATRALAILLSLGMDAKFAASSNVHSPPPPALILKSRHQFKKIFEELLVGYFETRLPDEDKFDQSFGDRHLLVDWTVCYAIFEYLTSGLDVASEIFGSVLQRLLTFSKTIAHDRDSSVQEFRNWSNSEILYTHYVQLHVMHNNVCPSASLGILRKVLQEALEVFPDSQHLNNLLLDIEAKSHIARRLRIHYDARLRDNSSPGCVSAIFAIVSELERQKNLMDSAALGSSSDIIASGAPVIMETGVTHRLRALFEKMVRQPTLRHCVLIWRLYINFEVTQANKNAKAIFYNAIQQCPWAKVLYLDAIEHFPQDVQEMSDLLTEKEIRMQVPLEEIDLLVKSTDPTSSAESCIVDLNDINLPPD